jgi:acetyl esterase/lipase
MEPAFIAQHDIVYVPGGKASQSLDIVLPNKQTEGKRFPVVVWIHGGGWEHGDKRGGPMFPLIARGIACVSINYRLSDEATWPAQIHDCKAAIRWLRAHGSEFNLDTKKIGVWGASAGGHLVALLGTSNGVKALEGNEGNLDQSSDVQAVCDFFGPSDLPAILPSKGGAHGPVSKFLGGSDTQVAKEASPVTYVTGKAPPFLIIHGEKDTLVPVSQSEELADVLKKAGANVTLKVVPGAGHGMGFGRTEYAAAADFFKEQLR